MVETDDDGKGETIGWIESNSFGFWLEELTNVALRLILSYVSIEGKHCHQDGHASIPRLTCIPSPHPGSITSRAMTEGMKNIPSTSLMMIGRSWTRESKTWHRS